MKFSEKFPSAQVGDIVEYGNYEVSRRQDNCIHCGKLTSFKDIYSGAYVCSDECEDAYFSEYFKKSLKA